ncbi:MAG TPA: hypothetical protein VK034_15270, partial [Enhygromyxa sp.]|nr:hypothetical protein [Enhygromyxa sp.]
MTDLLLTDSVDSAEALLEPVGVPRQVIVDHQVRALKVDAFAGGVVGDEHEHVGVVHERGDAVAPVLALDLAVDLDDRIRRAELVADLGCQVGERVHELGEHHELAARTVGASHQRIVEDRAELPPLAVVVVVVGVADLLGELGEVPEHGDLGLELAEGLGRCRVIEDDLFERVYLFLGRLVEIVGVDVHEVGINLEASSSLPTSSQFLVPQPLLESLDPALDRLVDRLGRRREATL